LLKILISVLGFHINTLLCPLFADKREDGGACFMLLLNSSFGSSALICAAFMLDSIIGDPVWIPHPVVIIGAFISRFENYMNHGGRYFRKFGGILLTLLTVLGTYFLTRGIISAAYWINPWLAWIITLWLLATTFASKCLAKAGKEIYNLLKQGNLPLARQRVSWIVGRDTKDLPQQEVVRATVETVAENIVDGITSPLFFALVGGLPLAMAYKAVNTLDSMVGYKSERYFDFGWASARLDDLANFIPARITSLLLVIAAGVCRFDYKTAFNTIGRDAKKHPSPNSGYSESAVAGALGIRLGGYNFYGGVKSFRAYMGESKQELSPRHILETVKLMYVTAWLFLIFGIIIKLSICGKLW
jgi:adenosylcobinamide-phosphate synthase